MTANLNSKEFLNPTRECDLVMKGGVTSGIVYPPVVIKLASKGEYRFRNIGGTSAGAIAAAATAAAEYGRSDGGFIKLQALSDQLGEEDRDHKSFLFKLFQPAQKLEPLMNVLIELLIEPKQKALQLAGNQPTQPQKQSIFQRVRSFIAAVQNHDRPTATKGAWIGVAIGLLLALVLAGLAAVVFLVLAETSDAFGWGFLGLFLLLGVPLGAIGYWLGILVFGGLNLFGLLTQELPRTNLFGLCTGLQPAHRRGLNNSPPALTDWLNERINDMAGLKPETPLTFGLLRQKKLSDETDVGINLQMMTSNLSQNQPYSLPFEKQHFFIFKETEFRQLFPASVVDYLKQTAGKRDEFEPPNGFYFLPDPDNLPVIVAMRMSLSFPLLISAVPLWTISQSAFFHRSPSAKIQLSVENLQQNWFSDGGICSNFPIHFFDAWLPSRPTFGINLASVAPEMMKEQSAPDLQQAQRLRSLNESYLTFDPKSAVRTETDKTRSPQLSVDVSLPEADAPSPTEWIEIKDNLTKFIWQIFLTAQNYRDTMQSELPGYRERIVQIRLTDQEGGLNLTMGEETIKKVVEKGKLAGEQLQHFNFDHHKWVRFRVLMGLLEEKLKEVDVRLEGNPADLDQLDYETLLKMQEADKAYPYRYPEHRHREKAERCIQRIRDSVREFWDEAGSPSLDEAPPLPKSTLRTMPKL